MFRQCIHLRAAQTEGVSGQDHPSHRARIIPRAQSVPVSSSKGDRLEPQHRVQSCSELSQHSTDIMMAEPQRCLAAMSSQLTERHKLVKSHMLVGKNLLLSSGKAWEIMAFTSSVPCPQTQSTLTHLGGEPCKGWERS